jgi:uncharacterized protein YbjQ (UPF0145 family)
MLVVTIDHVPGHRIIAILGEVIGTTVRPDNPYIEGVESLNRLDGEHPHVQEVIHTRQEAVTRMMERARSIGANAIVGMRFDHRTIGGGWSEICAYGTAMVLSRRRSIRRGPEAPSAPAPPRQRQAAPR